MNRPLADPWTNVLKSSPLSDGFLQVQTWFKYQAEQQIRLSGAQAPKYSVAGYLVATQPAMIAGTACLRWPVYAFGTLFGIKGRRCCQLPSVEQSLQA